jgi:hypothetical protein
MIQRIKDFLHSPDYTAWLISTGMVLFVIHNRLQPFINYIFLPQVGIALIIFGLIEAWDDAKKLKQKITLGSKWVWIPMLVIVASCWLRIPFYRFQSTDIAGALLLSVCFGLYLASRVLGDKILIAFLPALIIEAISTIVLGLVYPGLFSGGIITSPPSLEKWANYEFATGFMLFSYLLYQGNHKWLLGTLLLVALFFTGAPEALFLVGLFGILLIIRKDWNWRKILISLGVLIPIITIWTVLGYTQSYYLWGRIPYTISSFNDPAARVVLPEHGNVTLNPVFGRTIGYQQALENLAPLGHGIQITTNNYLTVHNVPLIIVDQIGIPAAIAWTIATVYLLTHSKQKYLWIMFIGMGLIDHYTWDNALIWWWTIAGTSMVTNIKNDYIFKNKS